MYAFRRYNPDLSRRTCRVGVYVLVILIVVEYATANTQNDASVVVENVETHSGQQIHSVPRFKRAENSESTIASSGDATTSTAAATATTSEPTASSTDKMEEKPPQRFEFVSVNFHRVEIPFIIALWIFCASLAKIGFHMAPKLSEIFPESCLLVVVGVVIGVILVHVTGSVHMSPLTPDTFFIYMLPPIILDAGYFMPNRLFFDHLGTILLFAVVGTIFNTVTIGASLWAVGQTGMFQCGDTEPLDMFLFAALISAVDPVAVLAVFEEIHVNEILYIVVFGESLLNDAVTVVLYHMFEAYTAMKQTGIITMDVVAGCANFFVVAVGGTVIGVIWGFATGFVTRFTNEVRVIEPIFIFVMAYMAYLCAEIFHMSGILAITFCGITMKNYVEANISHKSHTTIKYTMKMLSSSSETIIFMFLGVATVNKQHTWNTWFVILTIIFCSVYRTIGVILLTALANRFRLHQLSKVEKFVMSYGGLRGAVAFALVLLIDKDVVPLQPMFMTTTIAVVYFTVFFQGITIKPLVKILNVKTAEKRKPTMNERIHEKLMDHLMAGVEDILGQHGNYHVRDRFKRFDNKYIRPFLLRNYQGAEPKILETYSKLAMRDAMEFMRRNASTIGNISGTESMSGIFKNYTAGNLDGRCEEKLLTCTSFSQLDSSNWNVDMQELEYNPSKKDLTDAKIHHLLAEELCQPKRHRRLSYSRHAVNDRDLTTQVNYKMHYNMRRLVGDSKRHHHKRHSKKLAKDGKQNHVSFPEFQQNGTAKQFSHDYITQVLSEEEIAEPKSNKEEWDSPITFTAKSSLTDDSTYSNTGKRTSRGSIDESTRVTTPTATETMLPWKRDDEDECSAPLQQCEFPAWASNKEYLAYNSPSATFLGGLENTRSSVIGLFRRDSAASGQISSNESSPQKERRSSTGPNAVILIEEDVSDPLGVLPRQSTLPTTSQAPQTPNPRKQVRRGSMLEITGSITRKRVPDDLSNRRASWLPPPPRSTRTPRSKIKRQKTISSSTTLMSSPSPTPSDSSMDEEDADLQSLMKAGF